MSEYKEFFEDDDDEMDFCMEIATDMTCMPVVIPYQFEDLDGIMIKEFIFPKRKSALGTWLMRISDDGNVNVERIMTFSISAYGYALAKNSKLDPDDFRTHNPDPDAVMEHIMRAVEAADNAKCVYLLRVEDTGEIGIMVSEYCNFMPVYSHL